MTEKIIYLIDGEIQELSEIKQRLDFFNNENQKLLIALSKNLNTIN